MKKLFLLTTIVSLLFVSCNNDEPNLIDFAVKFGTEQVSLSETDATKELMISFSREASENGIITISVADENSEYGVDYKTTPAAENGKIKVSVNKNDTKAKIVFHKLKDPIEGTVKSVAFTIESFDHTNWVKGTTPLVSVSFTPIASKGGIIDLQTGGSNEPNQVYIDLSSNTQKAVRRDTWELGFYNGSENRVFLNNSLLVAAAELSEFTNLKDVTESTEFSTPLQLKTLDLSTFTPKDVEVKNMQDLMKGLPVSYTQYHNIEQGHLFTDNAQGRLSDTAFTEVSATEANNYVYIISLGREIPTEAAKPGSINTTGEHRGFMKVRITMSGENYKVQYAPLDETENIKEIVVAKNANKVLTALSLSEGKVVDVEPNKDEWDINFTGVFSTNSMGGVGVTYSDYAVHNTLGGVGMYQVTTYKIDRKTGKRTDYDVPSYNNFKASDIDNSKFVYDNRGVINSGWRSYSKGIAKDDRYFILKDTSGNLYKIKFTALLSQSGERGYSQFTYEKL